MPQVTISTDDGEIVENFNTYGWDFTKGIARAFFISQVLEAIEDAIRLEEEIAKGKKKVGPSDEALLLDLERTYEGFLVGTRG